MLVFIEYLEVFKNDRISYLQVCFNLLSKGDLELLNRFCMGEMKQHIRNQSTYAWQDFVADYGTLVRPDTSLDSNYGKRGKV